MLLRRARGEPLSDDDRLFLANLDRQEVNRSPAALAFNQMRDEMLERLPPDAAPRDVIMNHPNVARQEGGELLTRQMAGRALSPEQTREANAELQRELKYIKQWLKTMDFVFPENASKAQKFEFVKEQLRQVIQRSAARPPLR